MSRLSNMFHNDRLPNHWNWKEPQNWNHRRFISSSFWPCPPSFARDSMDSLRLKSFPWNNEEEIYVLPIKTHWTGPECFYARAVYWVSLHLIGRGQRVSAWCRGQTLHDIFLGDAVFVLYESQTQQKSVLTSRRRSAQHKDGWGHTPAPHETSKHWCRCLPVFIMCI